MNRRLQLAQNLAVTLANGDWTKEELHRKLIRRLPVALHRLAIGLSDVLIAAFPVPYAPAATVVAHAFQDSPGFWRILRYCERRGVWPNLDLAGPTMAPAAAFKPLDLPQLTTVSALADWLMVPLHRLDYLVDLQGRAEAHFAPAVHHYCYATVPKQSKGVRLIAAPKPCLKALQRRILHGIVDLIPSHPAAFGFVKGRSCLGGAGRHAAEDVVLRLILRTFFPRSVRGVSTAYFAVWDTPKRSRVI